MYHFVHGLRSNRKKGLVHAVQSRPEGLSGLGKAAETFSFDREKVKGQFRQFLE